MQAVTTPNNTDNEGDDASKREEGRAIEEMKKGRAVCWCEAGKKRGKKAEARDGGDGYRPFVWWTVGNATRRRGGSVDAAAGRAFDKSSTRESDSPRFAKTRAEPSFYYVSPSQVSQPHICQTCQDFRPIKAIFWTAGRQET